MKTLKAVVAKYNQTSLILRILIGLAVGSVLALVAPGAGWVGRSEEPRLNSSHRSQSRMPSSA